MPGIVTRRFRIHNANQLFESLSEAAPTRYFVFIGRTTAFTSDSNPPTPSDTIQNTRYDAWRDMIAMKRIQTADASYATTRYNWTTGTVYTQYTDTNSTLFSATPSFYVLTSDNNVYKCLDNARGAASTSMPTGTGTAVITTADNYRWKFMYTLSAADALKFLTTSYLPVKTLTANDGSAQWTVQQAAANGAIHHVVMSANGTGYLSTSNSFSSVTNSTVVVLKSNASATDDIYNYSALYVSSGLGSGQVRKIVNYVGASRTVTLNSAFTVTPNTSSVYRVAPNAILRGDSGAAVATRATAYVSNCNSGQIRAVTMIAVGLNYSTANITFVANGSQGSGAAGTPVISSPGGHGSDPVGELSAHNVMLNVKLTGAESNTFPTNTDFRIIGLIRDPNLRAGPAANASVIDQCTRLTVTTVSGDFTGDEILTGGTSGAKARLVRFANTNAARTQGTLRVIRVTTTGTAGTFSAGETVTGATSGKTAVVSSLTRPACREFTGDIIYTENRSPVSRASDQIEDIKLTIRF